MFDRNFFLKILKEKRINNKTFNIIDAITNMISKITFAGELFIPFKIKTGITQGGLVLTEEAVYCLFYSTVLWKKVISEWRKLPNGKKLETEIDYLAFADNRATLLEEINQSKIQIK